MEVEVASRSIRRQVLLAVMKDHGVMRARMFSALEWENGRWLPLVPNGSVDAITGAGGAQDGQKKSYQHDVRDK